MSRSIEMIVKEQAKHWVGNGFYVSQYFPEGAELFDRFSPFLLMDYNAPHYSAPAQERRGVGAHPHRGFETVTIDYSGVVEHHDNKGNHGILNPGDVQWMTAGSGILHKEYHGAEFTKKGGMFHMVQLWVNLPRDQKMTEPRYQTITKEQMGTKTLDQQAGEVSVIAGQFQDVKGPVMTFSPMNVYNLILHQGHTMTIDEPGNWHTGFLVVNGSLKVNGQDEVNAGDFVLMAQEDADFTLEATSDDAKVLMLSGEPLDQPVVAHGPFVMSTRDELLQAFQDFNEGKFGPLDF